MAKPPRKIPGTTTDPSTTTTRPPSDSPASPRSATPHSLPDVTGGDPAPGSSSTTGLPEAVGQRPSVIVTHMPDPQANSPVRPSGANRSADPSMHQADTVEVATGAVNRPRIYIDADAATLLTSVDSSPDGIRYDKHKKTYVDMEGGTVMVRRNADGSFQHTHAGESSPTGDLIERIPGSKLWRWVEPTATTSRGPEPEVVLPPAETADTMPGPSKRPRLDPALDVSSDTDALMQTLFSRRADALDLSSGQWRNWGKAIRPETGDSIEIDGAYYPIVSRAGQPDAGLVYVQHPGFAPVGGYDAFEHMLRNEPSHQPRWALKRNGRWRVLENQAPFEMPMTQYVATAFKHLSNHCEGAIARAVFDHSTQSGAPDNHALSMMVLTLRHWLDRVNNEAPTNRGLLDPLMLLPPLPTQPDRLYPGGILSLPASSTAAFVRIDFDPQRFPEPWNSYATAPTPANLRMLFSTLLQDNGYSVNPSSRALQEGALIFHREGIAAVFVLKLPRITGDSVPRPSLPGAEISSSLFQTRLTSAAKQELDNHLARNQVVYLMGGVQHTEPGKSTLFIVREG